MQYRLWLAMAGAACAAALTVLGPGARAQIPALDNVPLPTIHEPPPGIDNTGRAAAVAYEYRP